MEGWGYAVTPVTGLRPNQEWDALVAQVDAVYISENLFSGDLNTKIKDAAVGILNEQLALNADFELASTSGSTYTNTQINITDNTHYVTSAFTTGNLLIASTAQPLLRISGTLAPDLQPLAKQIGGGFVQPVAYPLIVGSAKEGGSYG